MDEEQDALSSDGGGPPSSKRCFVGNLSWDVAWQDLKDHMRAAGEVVYADVLHDQGGRSKGCGIVEYATVEQAREAMATLQDTELCGRPIFVREDRETPGTRGPGGGRGGTRGVAPAAARQRTPPGAGAGGGDVNRRVFVANLSFESAWQDLKDHMRQAGDVIRADVMTDSNGRSRGCGVVEYDSVESAQRAIAELHDTELEGRRIFVRLDREQAAGGGRGSGPRGSTAGRPSAYDYSRGGGGEPRGVCFAFEEGTCRYGDSCRFSHGEEAAQSSSYSGGAGGYEQRSAGCQVFVSGLDPSTTWADLKDHFGVCGSVQRADVAMDNSTKQSKGWGTVRFATSEAAQSAIITLNGSDLGGASIQVREDRQYRG